MTVEESREQGKADEDLDVQQESARQKESVAQEGSDGQNNWILQGLKGIWMMWMTRRWSMEIGSALDGTNTEFRGQLFCPDAHRLTYGDVDVAFPPRRSLHFRKLRKVIHRVIRHFVNNVNA